METVLPPLLPDLTVSQGLERKKEKKNKTKTKKQTKNNNKKYFLPASYTSSGSQGRYKVMACCSWHSALLLTIQY